MRTSARFTHPTTGETIEGLCPGDLSDTYTAPSGVTIEPRPDAPATRPRPAWCARAVGAFLASRPTLAPHDESAFERYVNPLHMACEKHLRGETLPDLRLFLFEPEADLYAHELNELSHEISRWGVTRESHVELLESKAKILGPGEAEAIVDAARAAPRYRPDRAEAWILQDQEDTQARRAHAAYVKAQAARAKQPEETIDVTPEELGVYVFRLSAFAPVTTEERGLRYALNQGVRQADGSRLIAVQPGKRGLLTHPAVTAAGSPYIDILPSREPIKMTRTEQARLVSSAIVPLPEFYTLIDNARRPTLDVSRPVPLPDGAKKRACLKMADALIESRIAELTQPFGFVGGNPLADLAEQLVAGLLLSGGDAHDALDRKVRPILEAREPQAWKPRTLTQKMRGRNGKTFEKVITVPPSEVNPADQLSEFMAQAIGRVLAGEGRWLSSGELVPEVDESLLGQGKALWARVLAPFVKDKPEVRHAEVVEHLQAAGALPHTLSNVVHDEVKGALESIGLKKTTLHEEHPDGTTSHRRVYVPVEDGGDIDDHLDASGRLKSW